MIAEVEPGVRRIIEDKMRHTLEQLKKINSEPEILHLLYDLDLLPEQVEAEIRGAREEERERCAAMVQRMSEALRLNPSSLDHDEWADMLRKG